MERGCRDGKLVKIIATKHCLFCSGSKWSYVTLPGHILFHLRSRSRSEKADCVLLQSRFVWKSRSLKKEEEEDGEIVSLANLGIYYSCVLATIKHTVSWSRAPGAWMYNLKALKHQGFEIWRLYKMYYMMHASAASLHRASTDSLIQNGLNTKWLVKVTLYSPTQLGPSLHIKSFVAFTSHVCGLELVIL